MHSPSSVLTSNIAGLQENPIRILPVSISSFARVQCETATNGHSEFAVIVWRPSMGALRNTSFGHEEPERFPEWNQTKFMFVDFVSSSIKGEVTLRPVACRLSFRTPQPRAAALSRG